MAERLTRERLKTYGPAVGLAAIGFAIAVQFIKPAPPRTVTLAYAPDEGGARYFARKYQEFLKKDGITLDLVETKGSLTNLDMISHPSDASVAFVQSGTPPAQDAEPVV